LFTGKGGVGKTSVAAATALRSAERGQKTIVLSTDAAHSLADSFDITLRNEPREILPNLWGQEVEIYQALDNYWGVIRKYMSALLSWRGMDEVVADEVAVLPGMEELASLLYLALYEKEDKYDVVIVDCAPTGETLRLLSFPEVLQWWMTHLFPIQRRVASAIRPVIGALTDMPLPNKEIFESITELYDELYRIHHLLMDGSKASIRLVVNPEKMVIKEAQRSLTYLNLFGYQTDAIVCNRLLPDKISDDYFADWKKSQRKYHQMIEESFSPLPILDVPLLEKEVVGFEMLRQMGDEIYDETDPTGFFYSGRTQKIIKLEDGSYVMKLDLPFSQKRDVAIMHDQDEIDIKVGDYRRNIILPHLLRGLEVLEAKMDDGNLRIVFKGEGRQQSTPLRSDKKINKADTNK
jgi:arsenite-transporting ATPase